MVSYPQTHDVDEQDISLGNDAASIAHDFKEKLFFELAKFPGVATTNDCYLALSYVIRDRLLIDGSRRRGLPRAASAAPSSTYPRST